MASDPQSSQDVVARHRLAAMFEPRSIAVVGASDREGSFGERLVASVRGGTSCKSLYFVNPSRQQINDVPCFPSLGEVPEPVDLVLMGVGGKNLEQTMVDAVRSGAKSAVVYDACYGQAGDGRPLLDRLRAIAAEAGLPVCGGNGMGVANVSSGLVGSFYPMANLVSGGITLVAHSGSVFTVLAMNDPRYRFDLLVSSGQEIGATIDEYVDYAIGRPETRVIAVFMEAARNPEGFVASLERAREAGVPAVVCKIGRSEQSAEMARSHSGALAGSREAYSTILEECGAIAVDTVDQMMNAALLCASGRIPGAGGIGLVNDSGGLRELQMDRAAELGAPLAVLGEDTKQKLRSMLPSELEPSNPLDCASSLNNDFAKVFDDGLTIMAEAQEVSMVGFETDIRDDYVYLGRMLDLARDLPKRTQKPCFFYSSFSRANNNRLAVDLTDSGMPVLNGVDEMLLAAKNLQQWADRRRLSQEVDTIPTVSPDTRERWQDFLSGDSLMDETTGLAMLEEFGVPVTGSRKCSNWQDVCSAAEEAGYPVVLKTAEPGIDHKSDAGGVFLDIRDRDHLQKSYATLTEKIGPFATVQQMAPKGIELAFGCILDPDFGPLVMVSAGGTLIEYFNQRQLARPPFGPQKAHQMISELGVSELLNGVRGAAPADRESAARALSAFSLMCAELKGLIAEIDVNPVIVTPEGAVAVDALVVRNKS